MDPSVRNAGEESWMEVTVPKTVVLSVNTAHGDIKIAGVGGAVTAVSQQGTVEIHDSGADVSA